MSDEELRDQINKIAVEIEQIEQTAKQKEVYVRDRINKEFDLKISEVEAQLRKEQAILNEIIESINDLEENKKGMMPIVKDLEKKYNTLKNNKEREINKQLKAIFKEKKLKSKGIDRKIKRLEKELGRLKE